MPRQPKVKPARIQVSIHPDTKDAIQRLADVMDTSFAKLAGSLLDENRGELESLADALERAKADPTTSFSTLQMAMFEAQRYMLDAQMDLLRDAQEKAIEKAKKESDS